MLRPIPWLTVALLLLIASALFWRHRSPGAAATPAPMMAGEPGLMLWAWETPEDLRDLNPAHAGVAYLSREILLGSSREVRLRHQPLLLPQHVFLVAVVRVETTPSFPWRSTNIAEIAQQIAAAAGEPHVRILQVDFDARAGERPFYAALLRDLRARLPPQIVLSITALVSWCGQGSWLHGLPLSEAVPMFFRMGGPAEFRPLAPRSFDQVREPLCTGSAGLATDERWPPLDPRQRVYLFQPGSWSPKDLALINRGSYRSLQTLDAPSLSAPVP